MDLAQAPITAGSKEPKLLIEKLSVEVDTLGRSVERAPPGDSGRWLPIDHGLVKIPLL